MGAIHRVLRKLILGEKIDLSWYRPTSNLKESREAWVVVYESMGMPVKYFRWDMDEVWKWTKTASMASSFPTKEIAEIQIQGCEVGWKYNYEIRKLSV